MCLLQGELDAVEQRQHFDAHQRKAQADAADYKAMCDKVRELALYSVGAGGQDVTCARQLVCVEVACLLLWRALLLCNTQNAMRLAHA